MNMARSVEPDSNNGLVQAPALQYIILSSLVEIMWCKFFSYFQSIKYIQIILHGFGSVYFRR
jgi:hypothetical protein